MTKSFRNIKDILIYTSRALIHDIGEISKMQNATHIDIDTFVKASYKKAINDIKKGITSLYPYSKFYLCNNQAFRAFNDLTFHAQDIFNARTKSISDIVAENGLEESKNKNEIFHFYINPISNIPSYINGIKDFNIDIAIANSNSEISDIYSYNPISEEMLYISKNGIFIDEYRCTQKTPASLHSAKGEILLRHIKNVQFLPKKVLNLEYCHYGDNFSQSIINLLSGRVDIIFNLDTQEYDTYYFSLLEQFNYQIVMIKDANNITLRKDEKINSHDKIIIASRKTISMLLQ